MANRNFNRFQALEKEVKALYAEIAFDNSGEPTLVGGLGIESVALNGTDIEIVLQDKYNALLHVSAVEKSEAPQLTKPIAVLSADVQTFKQITLSNSDELAETSLLVRIDVKNTSAR